MSRWNALFWSKVGQTGVGKMGGGEQVQFYPRLVVLGLCVKLKPMQGFAQN